MDPRKSDASIASILSICISIFLLGCDPQKVVKDYFGGQGLNPLAVVRNDVGPGALILKQGDKTIFAESIFDYSSAQKPAVTTKELTSAELTEVLKKYEQDRQVTGSVAEDLLKSVLPTKIKADLGLTDGLVKIDLSNVNIIGVKATDIQNYLSKNSLGLRNFIATQQNPSEPYVVYEAYSADMLIISAELGIDVSSKVAISSEFKPLSSDDANFVYKRASKETIFIRGNTPYVFAVRTAKLLNKNAGYAPELTNFVPEEIRTGDEQFSTSVLDGYLPITLEPVKSLFTPQR